MKSTVIVPTYNERENIVLLVPELLALPVGLNVLIVDDNSPDSTGLIVKEMVVQEPRLSVIHRPGKLGLGTAYIAGAGLLNFLIAIDAYDIGAGKKK